MTTPHAKNFNSNQERGKDFEKRWTMYLYNLGYWVRFMHPAPDGSQPFDIIALKGAGNQGLAQVCAFDCKTLSGKRFPLGRAEDNQLTAFRILNKKGIHNTYFVIETEYNNVCLLPSQYVQQCYDNRMRSINIEECGYEHFCIEQNLS